MEANERKTGVEKKEMRAAPGGSNDLFSDELTDAHDARLAVAGDNFDAPASIADTFSDDD